MTDILSNKYRGLPYIKSDVRQSALLDNCYLFDIADGCKIVASRTTSPNAYLAHDLFEIMSQGTVASVVEHITSYTDIPLFVRTDMGDAMVISPLTNSCSMGMLIFATFGTEHMYRYAVINKKRIAATEEIRQGRRSRAGKGYLRTKDDCARLFDTLESAFSTISTEPFINGDITSVLEQRLYALSYYTACPVGIVCPSALVSINDFDMSYFTTAMLICMIISRDMCLKHGISVILDSNQWEVRVRVALAVGTAELLGIYSFEKLCEISRRRNISLNYYYDDYLTYVEFSPYEFDVSINGLKSPKHRHKDEIVTEEVRGLAEI